VPPTVKGVQDPLGRGTPLHLPTRLLGYILELAGPPRLRQEDSALTLRSPMSWRPGLKKSAYASANSARPWSKIRPVAGTGSRLDAAPGTSTAASSRTKRVTTPQSSARRQNVMAAALLLRAMPEPSTPEGRRVR